MSTNDLVLCRSFGSQPLVRRIWAVRADGVLVCTEEEFKVAHEVNIEPSVALAPFDCIYKYDPVFLRRLEGAYRKSKPELNQLWKEAEPFSRKSLANATRNTSQ